MNAPGPSRSVVLDEIASAIGTQDAHQLVRELGGLRIYVPKNVADDHEIARAIGPSAAALFARYFHGTWISLPMASSRSPRRVRELARQGLTRKAIAKATGYSERQVYNILGPDKDDRQGVLFGDS